MKILVLGAGLAGVTSAWYLARDGHRVTVVDRQPAAGLETSYANGGQISVSHPEPWANPGAPGQILRWLGREDAPLLFRLRADWRQWWWGAAFLRECLPGRTQRNTDAIARLGLYSRDQLRALREEAKLRYDYATGGILHVYFDADEAAHAPAKAALLQGYGMAAEVCSPARCIDIEPVLADSRDPVAGGLYAADDESGDAHGFIHGLALRCAEAGVEFLYGTRAEGWEMRAGRIAAVRCRSHDGAAAVLDADACVMALGSYSPLLAQRLGETLPIYPVKGYSVTVPLAPGSRAPSISLTDESRRIVCSRLGDRLRVAGTAELNGYDTTLNTVRCRAILARAQALFPHLGDVSGAQFWTGLRPATPSNVPIIGRSRVPNLYYNTGHGTLGWTLACGSARALADIVAGRRPEPAFPFRLG